MNPLEQIGQTFSNLGSQASKAWDSTKLLTTGYDKRLTTMPGLSSKKSKKKK